MKIYLSLLPKPSAVAALTPLGQFDGGYYDTYEPVFSVSKSVLTRLQVKELDQAVYEVNSKVKEYAKSKDSTNIVTVDYFALLESIDYKNSNPPDLTKQLNVSGSIRIDNRYVSGKDIWYPDPTSSKPRGHYGCLFDKAGFQSVDGMHPSAVGYAKIAVEILKNQLGTPVSAARESDIYQKAFSGDPLLSHFPMNLDSIIGILKAIRRAKSAEASPSHSPVVLAANILKGSTSPVARQYVSSYATQIS